MVVKIAIVIVSLIVLKIGDVIKSLFVLKIGMVIFCSLTTNDIER